MAVEHRSSHEYGDVHTLPVNGRDSTLSSNPSSSIAAKDSHTVTTDVKLDEVAIKYSCPGRPKLETAVTDDIDQSEDQFDSAVSTSDNFKVNVQDVVRSGNDISRSSLSKSNRDESFSLSHSTSLQLNCNRERVKFNKAVQPSTGQPDMHSNGTYRNNDHKKHGDDEDNEDTDDDLVDVTKDDNGERDDYTAQAKPVLATKIGASLKQPATPASNLTNGAAPCPPLPQSYMTEKDKFLMALQGGGGRGINKNQNSSGSKLSEAFPSSCQSVAPQGLHSKNSFDVALRGNAARGSEEFLYGVKADVVGAQLVGDGVVCPGSTDFFDEDLPEDFDMDCLDFDFEKYLDVGELQNFLEKGWRPEDSPQIPSSNYPVLGKISHRHHGVDDKDTHTVSTSAKMISNNLPSKRDLSSRSPPPNPQHAWREDHNSLRQRPEDYAFSPSLPKGIPPLPNPSPSPSSVASAAETLGGGSIKSKKKEELCEEWGFKDSRTADLMMARARKMKYNSERKKKLSKLDPHQRYQLFQKLEESGKIQHVRPKPAKVLPRKEYFKARQEEVQRQEFEQRQEEKTRVNRTFEWLHTQVGDHPISSSRINPAPGPVYSNQEMSPVHPADVGMTHDLRRMRSPPDHYMAEESSPFTSNRRYSLGDTSSCKSPVLPPISVSSVPSQPNKERISFRDNPVERSGGWGGGKKRSGNKR